MKSSISKHWVEPALLFFIAVCAYGLFIPQLGLFGDDWPHLWVYHMFGLDGLNQLVGWDRPFSAWVYGLIAPLAGENIWGYHTYLLFLRWVCATFFYFLLELIFPNMKPLPFWTAALFLIYPGFRQQPQPLEFILHFSALALLLGSFWFMLKAIEPSPRRWIFQLIGSLMSLSIFSVEYFIGLELLRPVLIWLLLKRRHNDYGNLVRLTFGLWLPYLMILSLYSWWRFFIFKFPTYKPTFLNQTEFNLSASIAGLGQILVEEIRAAVLGAWRQIITLPPTAGINIGYVLLVASVFLICLVILIKRGDTAESASPVIPLSLGGLAILLAGIPFWITGIPVQLEFPWDRSSLPFMIGTSLLISGGVLLVRPILRNPAIALLIALSTGMHYQNYVFYQIEWEKLNQFFWQMTWRAPGLEPGTILVSDEIPILYYGDNNLTPILNWIYDPDQQSKELAYNFFDLGERLGKNLPALEPDMPVSHGYRFLNFSSNSNFLLPVYFDSENCLKIIDDSMSNYEKIPNRLREIEAFANPYDLIQIQNHNTPPRFLPEPEHSWCYFYQKAGLAVQMKNWQEVEDLFFLVKEQGLKPQDQTEWLPFIRGLAFSGNLENALEITQIGLHNEKAKPVICSMWNNIAATESLNPDVLEAYSQLECQ